MSPFDSFTWDVLVLLRQFITVIYKLQKTSYRIRHAFLLPPFPSYFLTFPPLACSEPFMTLPACMRIYLQASHIDCINNQSLWRHLGPNYQRGDPSDSHVYIAHANASIYVSPTIHVHNVNVSFIHLSGCKSTFYCRVENNKKLKKLFIHKLHNLGEEENLCQIDQSEECIGKCANCASYGRRKSF